MRIQIVMHENFEAPAAIETWAKKNNHELKYSRVYQGDKLPETTDSFDFLVIMGGPQSPTTTKEECPYFDSLKEIGFYDITLTDAGKNDPLFSSFPETFLVGHWHGDMPGLTKDSEVLAFSKGCPRQIVKYTPKVWGFQCHMEFTPEAIEGMIQNSAKELEDNKSLPYIQNPEQLKKQYTSEINNLLFRFLDKLQKLV